MLLNNCLCGPVSYSPMGLVNASPTDYQSWVIGGGPVIQVACLKTGVLGVWSVVQTVYSSRTSWELGSSLQVYGAVPGVGFMAAVCLSLSHLFWYGHFLCCLMCRSHSPGFWISLRGFYFRVLCMFSESVREQKFRSPLCHHLGQKPLRILFLKRILVKEQEQNTVGEM